MLLLFSQSRALPKYSLSAWDGPTRRLLLPTTSRSAPAALSIALLTSWLFGNPLFPVIKTLPLRLATKAPVLTVGQNISPVYSVAVTVAKEAL